MRAFNKRKKPKHTRIKRYFIDEDTFTLVAYNCKRVSDMFAGLNMNSSIILYQKSSPKYGSVEILTTNVK